LRDPK